MSWETVKLGDIITTLKGYAFKSGRYVEKGCPIVRASNFTMDSISTDDLKFYSYEEAKEYEKYKLYTNDILIQTVGSWEYNPNSVVGKVVHVPCDAEGALLNQNIVKIIPKEMVDNIYLYYRLKCTDFGKYNIGNAVGAANQASITLDTIKAFAFNLPSIPEQKRIAAILSNYDNLIENNQKQIKLLEEAAQRLYKEWFVDLHFPGYENVIITDGVPEDWVKGTIGDIASFKRGKTITKDQTKAGNIPVVAGGLEPAYYHNQENTSSPVITVSGSGANAGFTRMYYTDIWASDCSFVDSQSTNNIYFVYCGLKSKKNDIDALQKGAAQPHVYAKDINALEMMIPNEDMLTLFDNNVSPLFEKIKNLYKQIELSKEARDRLLPKLMSGEIEV